MPEHRPFLNFFHDHRKSDVLSFTFSATNWQLCYHHHYNANAIAV